MIEALAGACGPTMIICGVLGSLAFIFDKPWMAVGFWIFAAALLVLFLICMGVMRWRGNDW